MNDWQMEELAAARRKDIRTEIERINLEKLAGQGYDSRPGKSRPFLFRLGSGLVALGRRLRRQGASRRRETWAVQNEWSAERR